MLEYFGGAEAIVVNKQKATGLWASDNANGYGTTGENLDLELIFGEGILLPFGLIWTFVIADCDERPGIRKAIKLSD